MAPSIKANFSNTLTKENREIFATIPKLTSKERRRIAGPVYQVILAELFEESYTLTARYTQCFIIKETKLFKQKSIHSLMKDNPLFLFQIIDYIKLAEKVSKSSKCNALKQTYQILFQVMILVESDERNLDWLVTDMYRIINKHALYALKEDLSTAEEVARLQVKYAIYLEDRAHEFQKALQYLESTLELVLGQQWSAITNSENEKYSKFNLETLHDVVAVRLFHLYVRQGKDDLRFDVKKSLNFARKALIAIAQAGVNRYPVLYTRGFFILTEFLLENFDFHNAYKVLKSIKDFILSDNNISFIELRTELYLLEGICHTNLQNFDIAMECFEKSLEFSQKFGWKTLEAHVHLNLGKLYSKTNRRSSASFELNLARNMFDQEGDWLNSTKANYLWAKMISDKNFPTFMILLKDSDANCCSMYHLRQWKNRCEPFWNIMHLSLDRKNNEKAAECLVEADVWHTAEQKKINLARWRKIRIYVKAIKKLYLVNKYY